MRDNMRDTFLHFITCVHFVCSFCVLYSCELTFLILLHKFLRHLDYLILFFVQFSPHFPHIWPQHVMSTKITSIFGTKINNFITFIHVTITLRQYWVQNSRVSIFLAWPRPNAGKTILQKVPKNVWNWHFGAISPRWKKTLLLVESP